MYRCRTTFKHCKPFAFVYFFRRCVCWRFTAHVLCTHLVHTCLVNYCLESRTQFANAGLIDAAGFFSFSFAKHRVQARSPCCTVSERKIPSTNPLPKMRISLKPSDFTITWNWRTGLERGGGMQTLHATMHMVAHRRPLEPRRLPYPILLRWHEMIPQISRVKRVKQKT